MRSGAQCKEQLAIMQPLWGTQAVSDCICHRVVKVLMNSVCADECGWVLIKLYLQQHAVGRFWLMGGRWSTPVHVGCCWDHEFVGTQHWWWDYWLEGKTWTQVKNRNAYSVIQNVCSWGCIPAKSCRGFTEEPMQGCSLGHFFVGLEFKRNLVSSGF